MPRPIANGRAQRRAGDAPPPPPPRFADGIALVTDGAELRLASLRLETGRNTLLLQLSKLSSLTFWRRLVLETGSRAMPRTRPVKRLAAGELAELCRQLHDLLDRGRIQHSTAGPRRQWSLRGSQMGCGASATTSASLAGPHRHHGAGRGATATHRRPPGRDVWRLRLHQGGGRLDVLTLKYLSRRVKVRS